VPFSEFVKTPHIFLPAHPCASSAPFTGFVLAALVQRTETVRLTSSLAAALVGTPRPGVAQGRAGEKKLF
jgi:hypothetical protein